MQKTLSLLLFTAAPALLFGQGYYQNFKNLFKANDTVKAKQLLAEWESTNANDPELYTSAINFYYSQSKTEVISINQGKSTGQGFKITDSTGKEVGFLGSVAGFDTAKLAMAFTYADRGIARFPNRLDIRFGKCYLLQQIQDYDNFTSEVIKAIEYGETIKSNWLWTENKKLDDGEGFMLNTLYEYLQQLYGTGSDSVLKNMQQIGDVSIKYHPSKVEILSITAVAYVLTNNYDKALGYLKQAETINPKDFIVLNNIAECYTRKGDKENAIKYYQLTAKYGDSDAKKQAAEKIKELKR